MGAIKRLIEEENEKVFDLDKFLEFHYEVVQHLMLTYGIEGSVANNLLESDTSLYSIAKEWAFEMYHSIHEEDKAKWLDLVDAFLYKKQEMK